MGKTGKARHGTQRNGKTEGGKKKNERRKGTKERRQKMSGKCKNQQRSRINKAFEKIPRFDPPTPVIVLTG